jgi:hypothetical protein
MQNVEIGRVDRETAHAINLIEFGDDRRNVGRGVCEIPKCGKRGFVERCDDIQGFHCIDFENADYYACQDRNHGA